MGQKNLRLTIASGKGGVGKSMLASSLAILMAKKKKIVCLDADVDAPNLHLWLGGVSSWDEKKELFISEKAVVKKSDFDCSKLSFRCHFGSLSCKSNRLRINPFLCEGCGLCQELLPKGVVEMETVAPGQMKVKKNLFGLPLISGQLNPGETGSGKIVDELLERSRAFNQEVTLIDAPAGIGCPVISALKETDFVVLVTEPTPTGWADLKRILPLVDNFKLPWRLVINKFDLSRSRSNKMQKWAEDHFLGKIGYDKKIFESLVQMRPIVKTNLKAALEIKVIFKRLLEEEPLSS